MLTFLKTTIAAVCVAHAVRAGGGFNGGIKGGGDGSVNSDPLWDQAMAEFQLEANLLSQAINTTLHERGDELIVQIESLNKVNNHQLQF